MSILSLFIKICHWMIGIRVNGVCEVWEGQCQELQEHFAKGSSLGMVSYEKLFECQSTGYFMSYVQVWSILLELHVGDSIDLGNGCEESTFDMVNRDEAA